MYIGCLTRRSCRNMYSNLPWVLFVFLPQWSLKEHFLCRRKPIGFSLLGIVTLWMTPHSSGFIIGAAKAITFHTLFSLVQNNIPRFKEIPDNRSKPLVWESYRSSCSSPLDWLIARSMWNCCAQFPGSLPYARCLAYGCNVLALKVTPQEINAVCPFQIHTFWDLNK